MRPYKCFRRYLEVMGPLLLFKMAVLVWIPLYNYCTHRFESVMRARVWVKWYLHRMYRNCLCCECVRGQREESREEWSAKELSKMKVTKLEMEYINIVSSMEVVIVYGWSLPMLVPFYTLTFFGFLTLYRRLFKQQHLTATKFKPVFSYLYVSLIVQQMLGSLFWYYTQNRTYGIAALSVFIFNLCWVFGSFCLL